jgi:Zn finger protein HypA/HybF involved in hydrogenase expression
MPIDYKIYPKRWKTEIVPAILARAGEVRTNGVITTEARCEVCGIPNHCYRESGARIVITIAHLDHDATNHEVKLDRLKAMCQKCHNSYDAPNRAKNRAKNKETKLGITTLL